MIGRNDTDFAAIGYEQAHRDGEDMGTIAVRAEYILGADGSLTLASDQEIVLVDEYAGDPHRTPLLRPADLVPFKPGADVTVLGRTFPPNGLDEAREWICGVRVGERRHFLRANGPRRWRRERKGWRLEPAEPVAFVDLDYRNAWTDRPTPGGDPPQENPLGLAPLAEDVTDEVVEAFALPSLDRPAEAYDEPHTPRSPAGFGPVPPFWRLRQRHAGTYDETWLAERHPYLPRDFDYRFYQCAHPDLVVPGYLSGEEEVELARLLPGGRNLHLRLPGIELAATYRWRDGREVRQKLNLDGLHVDLREAPYRLALTWRGWLPICPNFLRIDLEAAERASSLFADLPPAALHGLEAA
ncbi:DUF2169 family type VI secretion system accessory protein [Antarcticirhabdus aurantiaca]|uniref:DUF2169 domain-containing protein n=1 Tax=Antarcticirhabdus aurantiaca TaxID=2606717 RepID=A0ACD4NK02_9HYPH|nr:DUF2169 domain-containing protein [Antarcticirhabdus aurantiaca]WAJ27164.1 DUF2169 domain-containing protein [Jeongeuplla avenae]